MTSNEQIKVILKALQPGREAVNFYFTRFDVPMRVTVRNNDTGEVTLNELDLNSESLRQV